MTLVVGTLVVILLYVIIFAREVPRAIPLEDDEPQNDNIMAKTDFTYCKGIHCPSRNQCKRYVKGLTAPKESKFIQNCRHAKLFIHKDWKDEKAKEN